MENSTQSSAKHHLSPALWFSIILVLAFAVGYLAWAKSNETWPFDGTIFPYPEHKQETKDDETAGWKTYRNEEFGFEFKYPSDWGNFGAYESLGTITLTLPTNDSDFSNEYQFLYLARYKKIEWEQLSEEKISASKEGLFPNYGEWFAEHDGIVWVYSRPQDGPADFSDKYSQVDKILSTFKFIEGVTSQDYNGKKYSVRLIANEEAGSHIFDGAVIAAIDKSSGKIVAENRVNESGELTFTLPEGDYLFQPSPLHENRVVGKLELFIPLEENKPQALLLTEVGPNAFGVPVDTCEEKKEAIAGIFENANYCENDTDCQTVDVTSYPNFECFYEINKHYPTDILLQRLQDYSTGTCNDRPFNKLCPKPSGHLACVKKGEGKGLCMRVK